MSQQPDARPTTAQTPADDASAQRVMAWILLGLAGLLLVLGVANSVLESWTVGLTSIGIAGGLVAIGVPLLRKARATS